MIDHPPASVTVPVPHVVHDDEGTLIRFACAGALGDASFGVRINRPIEPSPDALGAACAAFFLWPAMSVGARLVVDSPVPGALLDTLDVLQEIFTTWYPEKFSSAGRVVAPSSHFAGTRAASQAVFFSGGVDSTFSLLRHRQALAGLIFVIGFDIAAGNKPLADAVTASMREAAAKFRLPLVEITTDLRDFSDRHVHWGSHYCGAAMAGMAHLLAGEFDRILIPGTMTWSDLDPFGTHPFTDELWSSPAMRLHHDACDVPRLEKFRALTAEAGALDHLRVCWRNPDNAYNCCHCEKCLRAMANLRALAALDRAPTFPVPLDLDSLRQLEIDHPLVVPFVEETIGEAGRSGDLALASALQSAVLNYQAARLEKVPKGFLATLPDSPVWRDHVFPAMRAAIIEASTAGDSDWTRAKILHMLSPEERQVLTQPVKRPWWRIRW